MGRCLYMATKLRVGWILATTLLAAALGGSVSASAQTATNLVCKKCVGTKQLAKKAVKPKNLHNSAKPAGIGFASSADTKPIVQDGPEKVYLSLSMTVPGPGYVKFFTDFAILVSKTAYIECRLKQGGTTLGTSKKSTTIESGNTPISFARVLEVSAPGAVSVDLACAATGEAADMVEPSLIGEFVPAHY